MILGLLGRKVAMGRTLNARGEVVAATFLSVGPCYVTQLRTTDRDGYDAVQIGYGESTRLNKPQLGHLGTVGKLKYLREVGLASGTDVSVGKKFDVTLFEEGERVHVSATSKGRGFAGTVRRHGFRGGPKTHGQSDRWRAPGAVGAGTTPGRVLKGTRMAGRMGGERVTVRNLEVLAVDPEQNLMAVKGAVPGPRGGLVVVKKVRTGAKQV